jgi:hypothetical protein
LTKSISDAVARNDEDAGGALGPSSQLSGSRRNLTSKTIEEEEGEDRRYEGEGIVADDDEYD